MKGSIAKLAAAATVVGVMAVGSSASADNDGRVMLTATLGNATQSAPISTVTLSARRVAGTWQYRVNIAGGRATCSVAVGNPDDLDRIKGDVLAPGTSAVSCSSVARGTNDANGLLVDINTVAPTDGDSFVITMSPRR
jgi:hypothetical protein